MELGSESQEDEPEQRKGRIVGEKRLVQEC